MLQTLLHVAINVSDLAIAEQFYGEVLGLPKAERNLSFPGAWYQLGSFQIHLIEAAGDYTKPDDDEKWGRGAHVAFAIADLDSVKQRLMAAGIPLQPSSSGRPAIFIQDPDGHVLELSQLVG